jgi:hypothetical protein
MDCKRQACDHSLACAAGCVLAFGGRRLRKSPDRTFMPVRLNHVPHQRSPHRQSPGTKLARIGKMVFERYAVEDTIKTALGKPSERKRLSSFRPRFGPWNEATRQH